MTLILEQVHSCFQSELNSNPGVKFYPSINNVSWKKALLQIGNSKLSSSGQVAHVYVIWPENRASQNALSWIGLP